MNNALQRDYDVGGDCGSGRGSDGGFNANRNVIYAKLYRKVKLHWFFCDAKAHNDL